MECISEPISDNFDFVSRFKKKVRERRIPLSGSIELTRRCNLRCVHCYLQGKEQCQELSTEQWFSILNIIAEAGCLYLLITGGDPLLHSDFSKIFRHAKNLGLIITIFSNGTPIDNSLIQLFKEYPPRVIDISLYGATRETYEKITGISGSYERCIQGINRLAENEIKFQLKTILMTLNKHEFEQIESIANNYGVPFRFDGSIFPRFNGDMAPLKLRLEPEEIVEKEMAVPRRLQQWQELYEHSKAVSLGSRRKIYQCDSGVVSFHINTFGQLQPCIMASEYQYDLLNGTFQEGWENFIPNMRQNRAIKKRECDSCEKISLCGYCPPFFKLETGVEETPSKYICSLGQQRHRVIEATNN